METQKEIFRQLITELRQEMKEKVEDTTEGLAKKCIDLLDAAEDAIEIPQCKATIYRAIYTVRTFIKRNIK